MATTADSGMGITRPVWVDPDIQSFPSLENDLNVNVVVVGAGISGVACARWLLDVGVSDVTIVESRTVASGATGRNAGFVMAVAPENFPPTDESADVLAARQIWKFTAENQTMIEAAMDEFGIDAEYRRLGSLGLAAYPQEWEWIQSSSLVANAAGIGVQLVDRDDLESPWLHENYYGGAWYPGNGELHPGKFVRGLAAGLSKRGVRFLERTSVSRVEWSAASGPIELRCGPHAITAHRLIIATNAYTAPLFRDLGSFIRPTRGQVLATAPLDRVVATCPVYAKDGFQYWRQRPDRRLVLGGWRDMDIEAEIGTEEVLNPGIQDRLTEAAYGLCGGQVDIEYRWSGIMGFTADRRPLVGRLPHHPNTAICAGFSGHGLAMAFHSAKVAVASLLGGETPYDGLFAPTRRLNDRGDHTDRSAERVPPAG